MKKNSLTTTAVKMFAVTAVTFFIALAFSCNKDFQDKLKPSSGNDTANVNLKSRKILYIIVDGVRGNALKSANAPKISKMIKNAIYTYDGLSDFDKNPVTNAGGWANMITGVTKDKHGVVSEDFAGNSLSTYPSLFAHLKQVKPSMRTVSVAASGIFNTKLAAEATQSKTFENDDAAVKTAATEELQKEDAGLLVAQFHSAELAGQAGSYENTNMNYTNAILKIDGYVNEMLTALTSRKNFAAENWLVVLASNKGGAIVPDPDNADFTSYGDGTRNNFVVFYNPRFSTLFVPKPDSQHIPYNSSSIRFDYTAAARPNASIPDANQYNFGVYGNYTIQVMIKSTAGGYYYPTVLSKRAVGFSGTGWNLFLEGDAWTFNSSIASQAQGGTISDGQWHKISVVLDGTNKKVRVFTDGVMNTERSMNGNNINNTSQFKLGYIPGDENESASVLLNNLQIYNVALTAQQISDYACKTIIDPSNPFWSKLIGYWPMTEGKGTTLADKSGKGSDLVTSSKSVWENFNDVSPAICPEIDNSFFRMVPNGVDIPFEIYQWLGVVVPSSWKLDGKSWTPVYSDIK